MATKHNLGLVLLILLVLPYFLSACTMHTAMLWEEPKKSKVVAYNETISHFLITEDGEKIVFIGDKYHYVFSNQNSLRKILEWSDRNLLKAIFKNNFQLNPSDKVFGEYAIICDNKELTKEQEQWLGDNGFVIRVIDDKAAFIIEKEISGDRYFSKNLHLNYYPKLNNQYEITIRTDKPSILENNYVKASLTPITIAEDGIATIGTVALLAIAIPFVPLALLSEEGQEAFAEGIFRGLAEGNK